jgi:hypothetical protein
LADKKVFEQDAYSFFIDDELCVVDIKIVNHQYTYSFKIDQKADTPLNQFRKKIDKKNLYYSLSTFGFLFLMVTITIISMFHYEDSNKWESIQKHGILTVGSVQIIQLKDNQYHLFYTYRDDNVYYRDALLAKNVPNPILPNGFPAYTNDAFLLTYSATVKRNNKLHLDYPTPKTVQHYRSLAQAKYQQNHPTENPKYCDCLLDIAYDLDGWQGYALLYSEQTPTKENERFNQKNYQSFINSQPFLDKEIECWQLK